MDLPVNGFVSTTRTDDWESALITGNGRQGALCYGGPAEIRITLSHERLFLPLNEPLAPPPTGRILAELRDLLADGRYQQAAGRVVEFAGEVEPRYATTRWIDPLVGAATLACVPVLNHPGPTRDGDGYRRSVDFATGLVTQAWQVNGARVRVETFASRAHDVVVVRLSGPVRWRLALRPIDDDPPVPVEVHLAPDRLTLRTDFPTAVAGQVTGHTVTARLARAPADPENYDQRPLLVLLRTVVDGVPPAGPALAELPADFDALLAAHTAIHGELIGRVRLELGSAPVDRDAITEELFTRPVSAALVERLFAAGRYAIISSSGGLPPTLQGVWSGTYHPAWSSGYTLNGNLPAALAALPSTGTPELLLPLFDLLDEVGDDLRANAERLYGARGVLAPTHLSAHGRQNHFGPVWCQTFWTAGAAWLGRLYVEYWRYTGDLGFLRTRALPFLRAAAAFYLDFVTIDGSGRARFTPSYSPENAPASTGSQATVDATADVAAVADLLRNLLAGTAALGITDPDEPRWRRLLAALPAYRIAASGELAEWIAPELTDQHAHRHASHLYPLWYGTDPRFTTDPVLRRAAALAVSRRLAWWRTADSDEMGYGLAQLGLAAARLGLAEEAYQTVALMARRYWRPSLVSTHNRDAIFNVDLCGGLPAVVAAMLLQGGEGRVELLPALPGAWPSGSVSGLVAPGPVVARRLDWTPREVHAVLVSPVDQRLTVGLPDGTTIPLRLTAGVPQSVIGRR